MAKKSKTTFDLSEPFGYDKSEEQMEYERMKKMLMMAMAEMGVTTEEYAAFLADDETRAQCLNELSSMAEVFGFDDGLKCAAEEVHPMPDADQKSLRLKVQMKGVSKPPMWREIVIPADFNFSQLHHAIQAVTGLGNNHLWQFQRQAYNPELEIGIPSDGDMGFGLEECTHDADVTPVTGFLAKKGDKLEYVYDFRNDWIFTVSVLEVMELNGGVAECTKWKCDFQPIENVGGVRAYLQLRDAFADPEALTSKQKKELTEYFGFESFSHLSAWIDDSLMDIEHVNERLADLPESGRMDD